MEGSAYQLSYAYVTRQATTPLQTARSSKACWAKASFNDDQEQLCFGMYGCCCLNHEGSGFCCHLSPCQLSTMRTFIMHSLTCHHGHRAIMAFRSRASALYIALWFIWTRDICMRIWMRILHIDYIITMVLARSKGLQAPAGYRYLHPCCSASCLTNQSSHPSSQSSVCNSACPFLTKACPAMSPGESALRTLQKLFRYLTLSCQQMMTLLHP